VSTPLETIARPDATTADAVRLRGERRARLFEAMAAHDIDVLVLSRPAAILYATGARQLWTAGTRPVGPACVVVRGTERTHLLAVSDEGIPAEIDHADLLCRSWNPATLLAALRTIPSLVEARTIGTDSLSPGLTGRLQALAPNAAVVDGGPAIWRARATKTRDELAHIGAAVAVADSALTAMIDALRPGVTERDLLGVYLERIASLGAPAPPTEAVACATPSTGPVSLRRVASDRPIAAGQLVVLDAGAFVAGYEGGVGRTRLVGAAPTSAQQELATRCRHALDAVIGACRAGATNVDIRQAWATTGEPFPPVPLVHGLGLGIEPPVIGGASEDDVVLVAGSVLSVTSWVAAEGAGGHLERDVVVVGDDHPEVISRHG
jgi:Xaa-Pro dipeptidase